jgi:hypothetical protein
MQDGSGLRPENGGVKYPASPIRKLAVADSRLNGERGSW